MKRWLKEWWPALLIIVGVGAASAIFATGPHETAYHRWFRQCVADGQKEYECAGLLRGRK